MDFAERYLYLRSMPGGPKFSEAALLPLAEHAEEVVFRRGARLLTFDTLPESVFFLMHGRVELLEGDKSRGVIDSPGAVGVLAVMADIEMPYDVVARDEVVALSVETEFFRETFEDNFEVALEIVGSLSRHLLSRRLSLPKDVAPTFELPATLSRSRELGLVERMLIVRRFDIFGPGALSGLTEVAQHFREVILEPGDVLYAAGDHADAFHLVLDGVLELQWPEGVEEQGVGSPISNLETFASKSREATAVAKVRTRVLFVAWETLIDVFEDHTEMMLAIVARLAQTVIRFTGSVFNPDAPPAPESHPESPAAPTFLAPGTASSPVLPAQGVE